MFFKGFGGFRQGLAYTCEAFRKPAVLYPFMYIFVSNLAPNPLLVYNYVLLGKGGWSYQTLNAVTFISTMIFGLILTVVINGSKIRLENLVLYAQIAGALYMLGATFIVICDELNYYLFVGLWLGVQVIGLFYFTVGLIPVIGRLSKYLPEGFESTGVTFMIAANNTGLNIGLVLCAPLFDAFGVGVGHYNRLAKPQLILDGFQVFMVLVAPWFFKHR